MKKYQKERRASTINGRVDPVLLTVVLTVLLTLYCPGKGKKGGTGKGARASGEVVGMMVYVFQLKMPTTSPLAY